MSIHVSNNDDYASVWSDEFDAYYGYEVTRCPKHHEDREACDEADCDEMEWCFKFTKGDTELVLTTSEIEERVPDVEGRMPSSYVMAGIAILIEDGYLDLE